MADAKVNINKAMLKWQ